MSAAKGDVCVIGGGFWGTSSAWHLCESGFDVTLVEDDRNGMASKAAAGIICKDWYKQDTVGKMLPDWWTPNDLEYGIEWLQDNAGLQKTGELFYNKLGSKEKFREDCHLAPSCKAVLNLKNTLKMRTVKSEVLRLEKDGRDWLVRLPKTTLRFTNVVIAAGAFSDALLCASGLQPVGVRPLVGRAVLVATGVALNVPITVLTRPYTHFTLRPWPGKLLRLGDTVERTGKTPPGDKKSLKKILDKFAGEYEVSEKLYGLRPVCNKVVTDKIKPGLVVAVGGHRVGLGLAGGVGRRVVKLVR